jgi:hypothetical protein
MIEKMLRSLSQDEWKAQVEGFLQNAEQVQEIQLLPPLKNGIYVEEAESWEDFLAWQSSLVDEYIFRGQSKAAWPLHSSIDRLFGVREAAAHLPTIELQSNAPVESKNPESATVSILNALSGITQYSPGAFALAAESQMVFKFQQRAHEFLASALAR